jgi:hypothetical protein
MQQVYQKDTAEAREALAAGVIGSGTQYSAPGRDHFLRVTILCRTNRSKRYK